MLFFTIFIDLHPLHVHLLFYVLTKHSLDDFQVSWSYYKATLDRETTAHARASWDEDNQGQPMVAINTAALV